MKNIFIVVLVTVLLISIAGTVSAELAESGVYSYYGYVTYMRTDDCITSHVKKALNSPNPFDEIAAKIESVLKKEPHTRTTFAVSPSLAGVSWRMEAIENGGWAGDKSAMIAVVIEAFASGKLIQVRKEYDIPSGVVSPEELEKIKCNGNFIRVSIAANPKILLQHMRPEERVYTK